MDRPIHSLTIYSSLHRSPVSVLIQGLLGRQSAVMTRLAVIIIRVVGLKVRAVDLVWVWFGEYTENVRIIYIRLSQEGFVPQFPICLVKNTPFQNVPILPPVNKAESLGCQKQLQSPSFVVSVLMLSELVFLTQGKSIHFISRSGGRGEGLCDLDCQLLPFLFVLLHLTAISSISHVLDGTLEHSTCSKVIEMNLSFIID